MGHTAKIRRRRTGSRLKKRLTAVALLGIASCAVVVALSVLLWTPDPERMLPVVAGTPAAVSRPASFSVPVVASSKSRRVYPYSIIPGGVSDRNELLRMIKTDKVVAAHYASFEVNKVREVTVTKPRAVYVSYRKGDKVYWTAKKLMLAEGETLLSDGSSDIRTRCGNRISDVPQLPVEAKGPTPGELDSSVEEAQDAPEQAGLSFAAFGLGEIGDMPSLAGQSSQSPTFVDGTALARTSSEPPSHGKLAQADRLGASPVTVVGSAPFGATGSTSGTYGSGSGGTGSPSGTGDSGSGSTPDMPTVLAPSPIQASGTGSSSGTQASPGNSALPAQPTDPAPTTPDKGATVPASIPDELLSPSPFPVQTGQAAPNPAEVPEPSTLWLSGVALVAMLLLRRKGARN
jgi:hypothetical protein